MSNRERIGFRRDLIYSTTPIPQRIWTRSTMNTVTTNSASTTEDVSHVSFKATIACLFEEIEKIEFCQVGTEGTANYSLYFDGRSSS